MGATGRLPVLSLGLPLLSGLLLWASFPRVNQGFLAWIALVPLLIYIAGESGVRRAFFAGWITGFLFFLGILIWIPRVLTRYGDLPPTLAWGLFVLLVSVLCCLPALAAAVTRFVANRCGHACLLLFGPAWVCLEFARSRIPFGGFPWLLLGYSQTDYLAVIQIADFAGVYGVSLLIAWINVALAWLVVSPRKFAGRTAPLLSGIAALGISLGYGHVALKQWDQVKAQHSAALLQGNLSVDLPESDLRLKYERGYIRMADTLDAKAVDVLVLPEAPSPVFYQYDRGYREAMQGLARRFPLGMVFNNIFFRDEGGTARYFNSAFFLDHDGAEAGRYDKIHLVPFGEYIPWQNLFFFSRTISRDIGSFTAGAEPATVSLGGHAMNVLICFEAVFPDLARAFVDRGSRLIINLTNDSWYGDTAAPYQHLAMARWRAVECRRYLLRAANSGISAVIEPSGRIQVQTGLFHEEILVGGFSFLSQSTFYARHGGTLPALCAIISCLGFLWALMRRGGEDSKIPVA